MPPRAEIGTKVDFSRTGIARYLTITTADVETAGRLDLALNAPIAIVHRSVVDSAGCLVFTGEGIYRGDTVRIDMKLK